MDEIRKVVFRKPNVNGFGLGKLVRKGKVTGEGIVVTVTKKLPRELLSEKDMIPRNIDGVATDVVEVGEITLLDVSDSEVEHKVDRTKKIRPVPLGCSVGNIKITAGTSGFLVEKDEKPMMVSNNHVFACVNKCEIGSLIVQPGCLPPGSKIITNFGLKSIEEIKENEMVLGTNNFVRVKKAMSRYHDGKLIVIEPCRNLPFKLTPEHPVLVIETANYIRNGIEKTKELLNGKLCWKKAQDLTENDWLLIPRIKEKRIIPILEFKDKRTYKKKEIDPNDPDFGFLIGLFLADGSANNYVSISLEKDDKWFIAKTKHLFFKFFGKCKVQEFENVCRINCYSKEIAEWFRKNCYIGEEKKIPDFAIFMENYWLKEMVEGLLAGDGWRNDKFGSLYTTSEILAYQLSLILAKLGIIPNIRIGNKERYRTKKNGKTIHEKIGYEIICLPKHKQILGYVLDDFVAIKIKNISEYDYKGLVYNLETEDNTYSLPFVVHNSYDAGGEYPENRIGTLYEYVPIKTMSCPYSNAIINILNFLAKIIGSKFHFQYKPVDFSKDGVPKNTVDCALCLLDSWDIAIPKPLETGAEYYEGLTDVKVGDEVIKTGRTTGVTKGIVRATDYECRVAMNKEMTEFAYFVDQLLIEPLSSSEKFSAPGDSGSSVGKFINDKLYLAGLLFAGSDKVTVVNKIHNVFEALHLDPSSLINGD